MTDEALFSAGVPVAFPVPYRSRETALPGMASRAVDDEDGFCVYISVTARNQLQQATRAQAPNECFGLVLGRTFQDTRGRYTFIAEAVPAELGRSTPGHVHLGVREMTLLRKEVAARAFDRDVVGWFHSHSVPSGFSTVDLREQATWPGDEHVGVLTFMEGPGWCRVYRGPEARPLPVEDLTGERNIPRDRPGPERAARPATGIGSGSLPPQAPRRHPRRRTRVLGTLILAVGVLAAATAAVALVRSVYRAPARGQRATPGHAHVRWSCAFVAGSVRCEASTGDGVSGWYWWFSDGFTASGPFVAHAVAGTDVSVTLVASGPSGSWTVGHDTVSSVSSVSSGSGPVSAPASSPDTPSTRTRRQRGPVG